MKSTQRTGKVTDRDCQLLEEFRDHLLERYGAKCISDLPPGPQQDWKRALDRLRQKVGSQSKMKRTSKVTNRVEALPPDLSNLTPRKAEEYLRWIGREIKRLKKCSPEEVRRFFELGDHLEAGKTGSQSK